MMIQAESGGLNEDLITEILLRLPPKSVGRFRCVAKQWLSMTSNPHFIRNHRSSSGFFLRNPYEAEFFSLTGGGDGDQDSDPSLFFLAFNGSSAVLLDSCNGLILCRIPKLFSTSSNKYLPLVLCVCNPITMEHDVVEFSEEPEDMLHSSTISFALAFDPSISPNFRIIALVTEFLGPPRYNVYKYFSESRSWKLLQNVYLGHWNFSIYWNGMLFLWRESEYGPQSYFPDVMERKRERPQIGVLDVEEERLRNPPLLPESLGGMKIWYLGESRGCLYVIRDQINHCFEILEMTSESIGWRLLHTGHLRSLCYIKKMRKASDLHGLIAGFIRGDQGDRLLLRMPGQIVSYHLQDKNFIPVCAVQTKYSHLIFPLTHTLFPLNIEPSSQKWVCWTSKHDEVLINLMVEHSLNGNKTILMVAQYINGRKSKFKKTIVDFKIDAWSDMVKRFNESTQLNYDELHLRNRLNCYKQEYETINEILDNDGFHWAPAEKLVKASEKHWTKHLKVNPGASAYKRKHVCFRELRIIFEPSIDLNVEVPQNTGQTPSQKRKRQNDN